MRVDPAGPLAGVRVLDASRVLAGPFCGMILGDLGAEVVKVERPGSGDETRTWGPPFCEEWSAYFLSCNRNKQGITLDLARPAGRKIFLDLAAKADILLENFLPSSAEKLGVTARQLHEVQPRLIICSISGFGHTGPMRDLPGYDFAIQAMSGLMAITGPGEGPPSKVGVAITDVVTGLYAAIGVLACLQARSVSGHGYAIDLALLDCALASQVNVVQAYLSSGRIPERQGNAHLQIVPYQLFSTADGFLVLAIGNDAQFHRFCRVAGCEELARDPRFSDNRGRVQHRTQLIPTLETIMRSRTTYEWQKLLEAADIPHSPILDYRQLLEHPQAAARELRVTVKDSSGRPVDLVNSPLRIDGAAPTAFALPPRLGEHTVEVLRRWLNLSEAELVSLKEHGLV